jgi:hypothetical protein
MRPRPEKQRPAGGGPTAKRTTGTPRLFNPNAVTPAPQDADAIPDNVFLGIRPGGGITGALPEQPRNGCDLAAGAETPAISDDEHEAACGRLRAALSTIEMRDPATLQRLIREMREPGWPDALETAWEATTTPRGKIYDAADGRGGGGALFRARLPRPWRHLVELNFDIQIAGGVCSPSMLVRQVAHAVRVSAQLKPDSQQAKELRIIADLFEQYPADAVDYAAEWAIHFDKRVGGPR